MMELTMDSRRLILRASLQKLFDGENVEKNVAECLENLSGIYEEVDDVSYLNRKSNDSDWTQKGLDLIKPVNVGNFVIQDKVEKKNRVIMIKNGTDSLRFVFDFAPKNIGEQLGSVLQRSNRLTGGNNASDGVLLAGAVLKSLTTGKIESPENVLLGDKSLSLDGYHLNRVERLHENCGWRKFLPPSKEVIYEAK
jgi:hypothetical protein